MQSQQTKTKSRRRKKSPTTTNDAPQQPSSLPRPTTTKSNASTTKQHSAKKTPAPPPPPTPTSPTTNLYVTPLEKKIRNLKKKLKKSEITEQQQKAGAALTEQQQQQLQRRSVLQTQYDEWVALRELYLGYAAEAATHTAAAAAAAATAAAEQRAADTRKKVTPPPLPATPTTAAKNTKNKNKKMPPKKQQQQQQPTAKPKPSKKTATTGVSTRIFTAETGTSFNSTTDTVVLDNVIKCMMVANLVRQFAPSDEKCARIVRCADLLCYRSSSSKQKIAECVAAAKKHAEEFAASRSDSTETAHLLRAVEFALEAIQKEENIQDKICQAKSVLGTDAGVFNFFAADEDEAMSINEVAARAIRSALT